MDRVFLDANVLFSAAYKPNTSLLRLWNLADVTLCSSRHALEEARTNLDGEEQKVRLNQLAKKVRLFEANDAPLPRGVVLPGKDVPIFLGAIAAQATHLLTGDIRHFGPYFGKKIAGVAIVLPGTYLKQRADKL
jgi:predicted nucleic acid-binding protein